MSTPDQNWWNRAREAQAILNTQVGGHPDVGMIDIGLDPQGAHATPVLRVHLRRGNEASLKLPEELDGIPIRVITSDYQLQQRTSDLQE